MEPSSSFVQHDEFLDFSCIHFLSNRKQSTVEVSSGKENQRRTCCSETEVGMFGVKKPTERKANFFVRFGCFMRPRKSRVVSEFSSRQHRETCARQSLESNNEFSRVAKDDHPCLGTLKLVWCCAFRECRETCARCQDPTCKDKVGLPRHASVRRTIHWEGLKESPKEVESSREQILDQKTNVLIR